MQGAPPLASPRLSRRQHGLNLRYRCPTGGLPCLSPACPAVSLLYCPHPPDPLPGGKGENHSFLMQGAPPLASPGLNPWFAAKPTGSGSLRVVPGGRNSRFAATPTEDLSLWAVPAAKERGDRGRGTSAFEMVLSPGAGIASAARVQSSCGYHSGRVGWRQTRLAPPGHPPTPRL